MSKKVFWHPCIQLENNRHDHTTPEAIVVFMSEYIEHSQGVMTNETNLLESQVDIETSEAVPTTEI